jgi:hypothetical protein
MKPKKLTITSSKKWTNSEDFSRNPLKTRQSPLKNSNKPKSLERKLPPMQRLMQNTLTQNQEKIRASSTESTLRLDSS